MRDQKLNKLILSAVFAALACVATMVITIPSPTNGYLNMGDCIVLISGWILGPVYGSIAAGIGSMIADIFAGYMYYAPGTFVIKALVAFTASLVFRFAEKTSKKKLLAEIASGVIGEIAMIFGYFLYAMVFLSEGLAAAAGIPGNIIQGLFGIISASLIYNLLIKKIDLKKLVDKK